MKCYKYIILGAGPSGLSFAHTLKNLGEDSFLVIEKESVAGGLCRSEVVDGAPLDIGGGHFLDVERKEVLDFLFRFMPRSEWQEYKRISKIRIRGVEIDYPLEANLWQFPVADQVDFLESIARAGCVRGITMPESFEEWITWKLGEGIAQEYMLPYNKKIWSTKLNRIGIYWLYKLPDVSFRETLQSCLEGKPFGTLPAHGVFLYPKEYGYGEVWKRMGDSLGEQLITNTEISSIDIVNRVVNGRFKAETIITTIPWTIWPGISNLPEEIKEEIAKLEFSSIDVDYHAKDIQTDAHWIYEPNEHLSFHRLLCRNNFTRGRGYWTETNSKRALEEKGWRYRNKYAYPLNTREKPDAVSRIHKWAGQNKIIGVGRWGTWEHMNSDIAVATGIETGKKLCKGEVL